MAVLKKAGTKSSSSKKVTPMFSAENIIKMGEEYVAISKQIKVLDEKKKDLSAKIKDGAEKFGVKDDSGSFYIESDTLMLGKVAKKSFSIEQEKAVQTLESMGIGDVVDVVTVRTVNEDRLQVAVKEGRLTLKDVEGFTKASTSYAVSVKEKEAMPEVEQTTLKAARTKK